MFYIIHLFDCIHILKCSIPTRQFNTHSHMDHGTLTATWQPGGNKPRVTLMIWQRFNKRPTHQSEMKKSFGWEARSLQGCKSSGSCLSAFVLYHDVDDWKCSKTYTLFPHIDFVIVFYLIVYYLIYFICFIFYISIIFIPGAALHFYISSVLLSAPQLSVKHFKLSYCNHMKNAHMHLVWKSYYFFIFFYILFIFALKSTHFF